jgi:exodeoxyribonuclease V gamma subunit
MFLEAIISARYRLHISYHGRSNQDNSPRPPSAVVRELQSVIATELEAVTIEHPLHIFSKRYFSADPDEKRDLFTFSATAHAAATNLYDGGPRLNPLLFADGALAQPPDANSPLWNPSPELMARFFTSPPAFIMRQRLGLYVGSDSESVLDNEPIDLGTLTAYSLKQRIVDVACPLVCANADEEQVKVALDAFCTRLQAEGAVAVGQRGTRWVSDEWENATQYLGGPLGIDAHWAEVPQARLADLLQAINDTQAPAGIHLQQRFSGVKAKDKVQALVRHICGQVASDSHGLTVLAGWNKKFETFVLYPAISDNDREQLQQDYDWLLALYRWGLSQPLPFVPSVSFAYAEALVKRGGSAEKAEVAADRAWFGDIYAPAYDGVESAPNRYCFGTASLLGVPGIGVQFEAIAEQFHSIWTYWGQNSGADAAGGGDV